MTKPFELQGLVEKLKSHGLEEAEKIAKIATASVFEWVEESLALEDNPMYKVGIPVIEFLKPIALNAEDKIDGIVGN